MNQQEWIKEFDEHFMETDVYPNDLIPKNDVLATHHIIKAFISTLLAKREKAVAKAYGGCTKCYGKGYATQILGTTTSSDFPDNEPIRRDTKFKTQMNFCTCDRGKQLQSLVQDKE